MKKKICDLKSGTPFKYKGGLFIKGIDCDAFNPSNGECLFFEWDDNVFEENTLVTVCKRIRKSDIKERK